MLDEGISTRRGVMCSHREPAYADAIQHHSLQQSELAQDRCVLLPLFPGMTAAEQLHVAQALRRACHEATSMHFQASGSTQELVGGR